ncbi:MAG TPA: hypothetical protein PLZ46_03450 [Bacteroidales bacterium]|nr:hypothetical protein [Bacteroidales bacterium]
MPPSLRSGSVSGSKSAGTSRGVARRQKELLKSLFCRRVPSGFHPCGLSTCALTHAKLLEKPSVGRKWKVKKITKTYIPAQFLNSK